MSRDVAVIGGGFGGLAVSAYLADAGFDVTILEQHERMGGRARVLEREGFRFDMGPSWYLMPDVFERFFGHFDRAPAQYYDLERLDPNYRAFFKDGDRIDIPADPAALGDIFESYESGGRDAFRAYLEKARESYEVGMEHFVLTDRGRFRDYLDPRLLTKARGLGLLGSMADHVADYFDHPKLRQLVQYNLVFLGGSPSTTPALYNLMAHVDFNLGVYYPTGGIGGVIDGMVTLAHELGVTFETGVEVRSIDGDIGAFTLRNGLGTVDAELVVSTADLAHTELELLDPDQRRYPRSYWESRTMAPSAFLLYLGVEGSLDPLEHHSLVLPTDWDGHFSQIFDEPAWPDDPAYYVCRPSMTDPSVAPEGHEVLFLLVPIAPDLEDGEATREAYREFVLTDLAEHTGVDIRGRIVVEERFSVSEFATEYHAYRGTALGLAHTLRQTGPMRPDHRAKGVDGLYYAGAYTRPGIGMPMCLISGEHAAQAVLEDHR